MKKSAITSAINAIARPSVPANAQYSAYVVSYKGYKRKWDARNDANFEKALKDLREQIAQNKPVEFALLVGYGDGKQFTEWKREVLYSNKSNAQKESKSKKTAPSAKTEKTKPALKENKKPVKNTQKKAPVAPVAAASDSDRLTALENDMTEVRKTLKNINAMLAALLNN